MEMTKTQKVISLIVFILILILGVYMISKKSNDKVDTENNNASTTTSTIIDQLSANNPNYKIEQVPITENVKKIPVPDLNRPVIFGSNLVFTDEVKSMIKTKITSLQSQIKSDPNKLLPWIDLGMYQKMAGDYEGAKISWKYVSEKAPTDFISRGNLGFLYAYHLKDNAMAEMYYKEAISKDPKQTYLYIQLAEVYRDVFLDTTKASAIIDQGLKVLPGDLALLDFKKNLN
jgi:tetratricopeptide (TPR) repeat protein